MAHRYDIYYRGHTMDCCVPLPLARPDIERAVNVDWDRHILRVRAVVPGLTQWLDQLRQAGREAGVPAIHRVTDKDRTAFRHLALALGVTQPAYPGAGLICHVPLDPEGGLFALLVVGWVALGRPEPERAYEWVEA